MPCLLNFSLQRKPFMKCQQTLIVDKYALIHIMFILDAKARNGGNVPNNLPHVHSSIQQYYAIAKMAHQWFLIDCVLALLTKHCCIVFRHRCI